MQPKTPLDREAHDRATSVYLPDRVIPMLPEIISNNLASLQPDQVRYTQDGVHRVHRRRRPRRRRTCSRAAIKSRRRFTYEEVDEYLADRDALEEEAARPKSIRCSADMHELAMMLRARGASKRGALELSMPEVKIDLDTRRPRHRRASARRTPRATRSSKSSCSRPTRRWPRSWPTPA